MQNLSPEFLMFFIQMMLLWFVVKIVYLLLPSLKTFVLVVLLIWGVVEAVWGVAQGDSGTCTKEGGIIFV